jgi:signal transduction histidine kinase/ligand-binding sensor domain-containing protein/DNA-binding response OmpR family regulator
LKFYFLHIITLLLPFTTLAQDYPVKFLTISDGLSNNSVTSIYQDNDGYIWFGTYDGLNRYDGHNFKVYRNRINDTKSLVSNTIYHVIGDFKQNIWVGSTKGISVYDKKKDEFNSLQCTSSNDSKPQIIKDIIHQIKPVSDKLVLVASQNKGLIIFENGSFIGKQISLYCSKNQFNYDVTAIENDKINNCSWLYIRNRGIFKYDFNTRKLHFVYLALMDVKCMQLIKGNLFLGTDEGLFEYNVKNKKVSNNFFTEKFIVQSIKIDSKNKVWIATDGAGIYNLTENKVVPYNTSKNNLILKSNSACSLFEDETGNMWIGTLRGGISMIGNVPKYFKHIKSQKSNSPAENFILSFCEAENNNLWIGTDGAGLKYWDRSKNEYINYNEHVGGPNKINSGFITGIVKDENKLWISTWAGGVNRLNTITNVVDRFACYNPQTKQVEKNIWLVFKDSQATIWASATNEGCLYFFDESENKFKIFDKGIKNLQSFIETSDGTLWGGNYNTLFSIDKKNKRFTKTPIGYPIRCILEDKNKNLWLGTQEGGLLLFEKKNKTFKRLSMDDGLPSNTILRLLEDKDGDLWMSTYNGICKFDVKNKNFRNFSVNDGLQSNQYSFNAGIKLATGEFLFGGINGFNVFYPNEIKESLKQDKILLSSFFINNQSFNDSATNFASTWEGGNIKQITIPYDQTTLSLEFVSLDYNNGDNINYAYYLDGWDNQWNYSGQNRKANYSRLSEGNYTFKVKTTNFNGGWNKEINLITIEILPPWYRTWWAYLLYLLAVFGVLFAYIKYNKNKEKLKYKVKIAELESANEKEIAEKQSSMFTYISHEFRTPLSLIINPLKKAIQKGNSENSTSVNDLMIAHKNARRLLSLVDQLLLFRKAENDADELKMSVINVNNLCYEIYQCFVNQAKEKNIDYTFQIPENNIEIIGDYEKIEISLFNLISNALKYTPIAGEVSLILSETETNVTIDVFDTGTGIAKEDLDAIFEKFKRVNSKVPVGGSSGFGIGLFIVRYFVEKHKGTVSCTSEIGKGSVFKLLFLKGQDHFENLQISTVAPKLSPLVEELMADHIDDIIEVSANVSSTGELHKVMLTDKRTLLIIDDNTDIRNYLIRLFSDTYIVYNADNGEEGLILTKKHMPDLVISDIAMDLMDGLELCRKIKENSSLSHIPVILLTASKNPETHLQGISDGADDYITKPFDDDLLVARVESLLKSRSNLRTYFLDSITLKENTLKVPAEYQEILNKCIDIIESNIHKRDFTIKNFAMEMGMSHRTLYTKIKIISGQTLNAFIRSVRIRRAAMLMLTEDINITQASSEVGFEDPKYFRQQFVKLFGMTPSEYIKKYKSSFNSDLNVIK